MRRWGRFFLAILALPVLILLNATPDRGADRRLAVAVRIGQVLLLLAAVTGFFWLVAPVIAVRNRVGGWLAVAVFGTLGTFLTAVALAGFAQVMALRLRGRRAMATVVEGTSPAEKPQFQFTDANGRAHVVSGPVSAVNRGYGADQRVPLLYLPGHPDTFVVDRFADQWGPTLCVLVLGLLLLFPASVFAFGLEPLLTGAKRFGPVLFLAVGGTFAGLGFGFAVREVRFRLRAARAIGVVTDSRRGGVMPAIERAREEGRAILTRLPDPAPGESEPWVITVEFEDAAEAKRRGYAEVYKVRGQRAYEIGDRVPVFYDPGQPVDLRVRTYWNWAAPLGVGMFGMVFVVVGLLLLSGRGPFG
jgi:hypothetical protein